MTQPKIVVVVPTCRPDCHEKFVAAWAPLFEKHQVTLVTVWDGESPSVQVQGFGTPTNHLWVNALERDNVRGNRDLFFRYTDSCRNLGFVVAAQLGADYVLTLDDDCMPLAYSPEYTDKYGFADPVQAHLDVLARRVPVSWMNTAHDTDLYLRGVPYQIRDEAPVMLSHGVWVGTPDFDGETQLKLELGKGVPHSLPYFVGPVPKGVLFPLCGMNVMVRKEALPYLYYAPMGPDTKVPGLNRFGDIWMGNQVKRQFDALGWAVYTGGSTVLHSRASDARKNFEAEKLGREWNEFIWRESCHDTFPEGLLDYLRMWQDRRDRYAVLIRSILNK